MAFGAPGKLTMSVLPRTPAVARESIQLGVCSREASRIASAMPGASRSMTSTVASGVTSVGARPVPPVVTPSAQLSSSAQWRSRSAMVSRSSGTISEPASSSPIEPIHSTSAGPLSSAAAALNREVLTVMAAARTSAGGLVAVPVGPSAGLRHEADAFDAHAALHALDHVVEGQRRDGARGHRLHLDAGPRGRRRLTAHRDDAGLGIDLDLDAGERKRERMGQGDE